MKTKLAGMTKTIVLIMLSAMCAAFVFGKAGLDIQAAENNDPGVFAYVPFGEGRSVNIAFTDVGGKKYLFLPSVMSEKSVVFHYDTETTEVRFSDGTVMPSDTMVNLNPYLSADTGDGSRLLNLKVVRNGAETPLDIYVMHSASISSVYINSSDPSKGRAYVDESKSNKGSGSVTMIKANGNVVYDGELSQIKARGNTTFKADKKAYQIKLGSSTDLTQTGAGNSSKTWILLANAYDPTLVHNTVVYRMASAFGLNAPDCASVDLYYDGNYRGNYLLCEKVQIGDGRVAITDLESKTDKANSGKDLSKNATATGANKYGDIFRYVTGVNNPESYNGGYLLELDNAYYQGERCYFITSNGVAFTVKSPENCSKEEMLFISEYVEEMVQAAANGGTNPETGKSVWDYIDLKSLSRFFVLQETSANADSFASSTYFYLNDDGSPMVAGPVWDFDDSYGIREDRASTEGFIGGTFIEPFMNLPDFRKEVKSFVNSGTYSKASKGNIDQIVSETASSQKMNRVLWNNSEQMYTKLESYDADITYFKNYSSGRIKWLKGVFATW